MPRTKTGVVRRHGHKAVLARTKGFRMTKNRLFKVANEADMHAGQYAYEGRKRRKQDLRALWITRISAGLKTVTETINYSRFIKAMKDKNIQLNRKILAEFSARDLPMFKKIVELVEK